MKRSHVDALAAWNTRHTATAAAIATLEGDTNA
jgi:hypothetical protein